MRKLLLAAALVTSALLVGGVATAGAADTTVRVTAKDEPGGHWFSADTRAPGTGIFEVGPAAPPLGTGSFELTTLTNPEKVQLFTDLYNGVALDDVEGIGYSTYRDPSSTGFIAG